MKSETVLGEIHFHYYNSGTTVKVLEGASGTSITISQQSYGDMFATVGFDIPSTLRLEELGNMILDAAKKLNEKELKAKEEAEKLKCARMDSTTIKGSDLDVTP